MNSTRTVLVVLGTRPEAVKMAPVIRALKQLPAMADGRLRVCVCATGQHREMLDGVLELFGVASDMNLDIMQPGQDVTDITTRVLSGMRQVLTQIRPDLVLAHGDTTSSLAVSLAAFYSRTPVGHVEAGLRTGTLEAPWPEEMNRRVTDAISTLCFAPTELARANLLSEGKDPSSISVTGNTVIDALLQVSARIDGSRALAAELRSRFAFLDPRLRVILVTGHRRESFGSGFERICAALRELAGRQDVQIVYPVHLNPNVQEPVQRILGGLPNVHLLQPLPYLQFTYLLKRCHLVITDSGGVQEEAPSLGKPVLVLRDTTERPEAVREGTVRLVGTAREVIVAETVRLLTNQSEYRRMSRAHNPYGDGHAAQRIANTCLGFLSKRSAS
jgi:UDP-N-acetylglucosamine 2-epimerase (non-hydrolysing)